VNVHWTTALIAGTTGLLAGGDGGRHRLGYPGPEGRQLIYPICA
jgi:hypothetical protein